MTEAKIHHFPCDRCQKLYQCFGMSCEETCKSKQANDCSACVRMQQDWGKDYFGWLDGPPDVDSVSPGNYYIQGFYGSRYDSEYLMFPKSVEEVRNEHPWITDKGPTNICDLCIAELLRKREIIVAKSDGGVYPCYCDLCDKLFERETVLEGGFEKNVSKCNKSSYQLPNKEWAFFKTWDELVRFPELKGVQKCLKPNGRVCDACFSQFEGPCIQVTRKERYPNLYDDDDNQ